MENTHEAEISLTQSISLILLFFKFMFNLVYDGSLKGYFSCVFDIYAEKITFEDFYERGINYSLIQREELFVEPDDAKSKRIENKIVKVCGRDEIYKIRYALKSCDKQKEKKILEYLKLIFDNKPAPEMLNEAAVIAFNDLHKRVSHEQARLAGFIRFMETQSGIYYAYITPDNDVTALLMPHFIERFNGQQFIIHDVSRNIFGLFNGKEAYVLKQDESIKFDLQLTEREELVQKLFKQYYNDITIPERKNTRLKDNWMPRRYAKNMFETR